MPQLAGSVAVSTQLDPHNVGVGVVQLDEHLGTPVLDVQLPSGATHRLVQLPQVAEAARLVSQPSLARAEQWPKPVAQALAGIEHAPAWHWMPVAPALTLGSAAQMKPQVPQLAASDCRSTHFEPQRLGAGAAQLEEQVGAPVVDEHRAVGAAHAFPH